MPLLTPPPPLQNSADFPAWLHDYTGVYPERLLLGELSAAAAAAPAAAVPAPTNAGLVHAAAAAAVHAAVAAPGGAGVPLGLMRPGAPWAVNKPSWAARGMLVIYAEGAAAAVNWLTTLSLTIMHWVFG